VSVYSARGNSDCLAVVVFEFAEPKRCSSNSSATKRFSWAFYTRPSSSALSRPLILKGAVPITSCEELQNESMPKNSMKYEYWVSHFDSQSLWTRSSSSREASEPRRRSPTRMKNRHACVRHRRHSAASSDPIGSFSACRVGQMSPTSSSSYGVVRCVGGSTTIQRSQDRQLESWTART
jgi:hypothetical protein